MMTTNLNQIAFQELKALIPGGVNSPVRAFTNLTGGPLVVKKGKGDRIYDLNGKDYIDYCMSWGSLILGHAHPLICEEIKKQIDLGTSYGLSTEVEGEIAREIINLIDPIEQIRFVSSGTEATMSAIRLARGYTKRNKIIKFAGNYHGHSDQFMISSGSYMNLLSNKPTTLGIPLEHVSQTIVLPYNDIVALENFFTSYTDLGDIAALILEPVAGNIGVVPATASFIEKVREKTKEIGALLIFDEVITGFRVGLKGACSYYKITPDLICLGKIIGGGFPAAAFGGSKEIMQHLAPLGPIFQAGTLSGNPVAMRAGHVTLKEIQKDDFYPALERKMNILLNPVAEEINTRGLNVALNRIGSMFSFFFGAKQITTSHDLPLLDHDMFNRFFQFMLDKGIYFSPSPFESNFISSVHEDKDLVYTREGIIEFFSLHHDLLAKKE